MTTVVFADLVGSTRLFERLGDDAASRFVTQIVSLLSQTFGQHQGRMVKLLGDGLFVVFSNAGDALAACVSIQKRLLEKPVLAGGNGAPVQFQIGIESGEVVEIDGDCFADTAALPLPLPLPLPGTVDSACNALGEAAERMSAPQVLQAMPAQAPEPVAPALGAADPWVIQSATPGAAANPRQGCEGRVLLGFQSCMAEQCAKPAFAGTAECVERHAMEQRRRDAEQSRK